MVCEEPPQLPLADPETCGKRGDVAVVRCPALDEAERARDGGRSPDPARRAGRRLRAAAQAGTEPCRLGRCSAGEEEQVLAQRRPGRTDGPAVDAGGTHADEEATVEAGVAGPQGAVADVFVEQRHDGYPTLFALCHWRFLDAQAGDGSPSSSPPSPTLLRMIPKLKSGGDPPYSPQKDPRPGDREEI